MFFVCPERFCQSDFRIRLFALSTSAVSSEARYMRVVFSESCPIASLMVASGMFLLLAMEAQPWRAIYVVSGMASPSRLPIFFRFRFTLCA